MLGTVTMINLLQFILGSVLIFLIWTYLVYPIFFSPLSKVPNAHVTAGFSPVWMLWRRYKAQEVQTIHEAHLKHGPIVRLGPNEVSVNCVEDGIKTVYSGGFEKWTWYPNLMDNYG